MKLRYIFVIAMVLLVSMGFSAAAYAQNVVTGIVIEKGTAKPLVGASVYIPDLKFGAVTDAEGRFTFKGIPSHHLLVQVTSIGYRNAIKEINVGDEASTEFVMEPWVTEINEVVVTGTSKAVEQKRTPSPVSVIPPRMLKETTSSNIIDAIANQPGVSQITTGSGISKPIIRGMGYNRVLVVNGGIRQEGQQWGEEHGVEVDGYGVDKVEILKGPASLAYGSDALAGVVNLIPAPFPEQGKIKGEVTSEYQANNGLAGLSAYAAGNQKGFVWDLRLSGKATHDYKNRYDGYVYNSRYKEQSASATLGINKDWGYSHLNFSAYHIQPGIVEGDRDSLGRFVKPAQEQVGANGLVEEVPVVVRNGDFKSYGSDFPFQKVDHYRVVSNSLFKVGEGNLRTIFGFQQNLRREFEEAAESGPLRPNLYFKLNTVSYDVQYQLPRLVGYNISVGINGMSQNSYNLADEVLIPEYDLFDFGVYAIANKRVGSWDFAGGIRYDNRRLSSKELIENGEPRFSPFKNNYDGVSGSLGATYQISDMVYAKVNLARGFRAPNIAELGSNGSHEGTLRYEIGDSNLKSEHSFQADLGIGLNTTHISAELNLFNNRVNRYIFLEKLRGAAGGDSLVSGNPAFKYRSGDANLFGGEVRVDIHPHPLDWLHFENAFSYVYGRLLNQPDSSKYLPSIPAARLFSTLRFDVKNLGRSLGNTFIKMEMDANFRQNRAYLAYNTETTTPGYVLFNAMVGTDLLVKNKRIATLEVGVRNLMDEAYQNHLSRLKYAPENSATGRVGVYNMGRNFAFKLIVPFGA